MRPITRTALRLAAAMSTVAALAAAAGLPAAAPASAAATSYTITNLGTLGVPVPEDPQTEPEAINASGQATGNSFTSTEFAFECGYPKRTCHAYADQAFLYSNGTMTDLGSLGGPDKGSTGFAINSSGEVAGVSQTATAGVTHATLWAGTTMIDLGALAPLSSGSSSSANGINNSGQAVGYWATGEDGTGTQHPWLYSNGTLTSLPEPSNLTSPSCEASAINNSGQIIGGCSAGGTDYPVLWQNGTVTILGTLGGLQVTLVTGINNSGQIAGWATTSTGTTVGFLDSNGTVTDLGASFLPTAINDNGVMLGDGGDNADLIDSGGTVQNLQNLIPANSGYDLGEAVGINDNGQIIAGTTTTETNPTTTYGEAVLLTPN